MYPFTIFISCLVPFIPAVAYFCDEVYEKNRTEWLLLTGNLIIAVVWQGVIKPVDITVRSELFPQAVKGFASSLAVTYQGFGIVIAYKSCAFFIERIGIHFNYVFLSRI